MRRRIPLLFTLLVGCGPPGLPARNSPVLTPSSSAPILGDGEQQDGRRDGVFAQPLDGSQSVVLHESAGSAEELFHVPLLFETFASSDDQHFVFQSSQTVTRYDDGQLVDLTPRLRAAFIRADGVDDGYIDQFLAIDAIDLGADGTVAVSVNIGSYEQLCWLSAAGDHCDDINAVAGEDYFESLDKSVVLVPGATYHVADGHLFVRTDSDGSWAKIADQAWYVRALSDGRVYYVAVDGSDVRLHVLGVDRHEQIAIGGIRDVVGHSATGLWQVWVDAQGDGSCQHQFDFSGYSACQEPLLWSQLVVDYVELGGVVQEIAHLDDTSSGGITFASLPLADGRLRLETNRGVFVLP